MKTYAYVFGIFALAFAMGGLPATAARAESNGGEGQTSARVQVTNVQVRAEGQDRASAVVRVDESEQSSAEQQKQEGRNNQLETSSSNQIQGEEEDGQEIDLELENDSNPATSVGDLRQKIEVRKIQLEQEAASTTPADRNAVKNANPVRLAVHSFLASRELLGGGIGQQVSEIAKQMNDSVATTTNAEAKIQSRGFLTRLLFGGDRTSGDAIVQEVAKNQENIQKLTELLNQVGISLDVKAALTEQITALETAQAHLSTLAETERKQWGLFSWRF